MLIAKITNWMGISNGAGFWQYQLFGNSVRDYLIALIMFIVLFFLFKLFQIFILKRLEKLAEQTKTDLDDTFITIIKSLKPPLYSFLAFYVALGFLVITSLVQKVVNIILIIWITYQVVISIQILIDYAVKKWLDKERNKGTKAAIELIGKMTKGILWVMGLLLVLANLGINVTSLIAGLGIGGIAIALALQNILGDLFSSFAIYFDKPFTVGAYITVGEHKGIVEKIGIKTTRIKSPQGEEIVISNQELTSTRVKNFKKMKERRIVFSFGVLYDTPSKKLKQIPQMLKEIIAAAELARFNRAHFIEFADSALVFEVIYYMQVPDFTKHRDVHQEILLKIKNAFEKQGIEMAYPTQTIYLAK